MCDLKQIESLTTLPTITTQTSLSQKAPVLLAILTEADIAQPPTFLKALGGNTFLAEDLKKKKKFVFYGGQDDQYNICYVKIASFGTSYEILEAAGEQTRALLAEKTNNVSIAFADSITAENVTTFLTGVVLANYKHNRKYEESAKFTRISTINVIHKDFDLKNQNTDFALRSAQYSLFCREVLNLRALDANPESMLQLCKDIAKANSNVQIEAIVDKELQEKGLNLIYSVGRGAAKRPCLVILKYQGNGAKPEDLIALVGKGVCFDAGGLNLKPTGGIEDMWSDKGGACTVLAAFKAIVELKLPVNVTCTMAFVENLVGSDAYHPCDIIKSHKGLTVEIGNTDAEGRLVLADAMSYTQQHYKPNTLIEFSTLTGAVRIALGLSTAGVFSNSDELVSGLLDASNETNERLWRLPIFDEHRNYMKGVYADLNNIGGKSMGGASCGAAFLERFVNEGVNWAHLDIAGTATSTEKFVYSDGATGWGVRLVLNYIRNRINKAK